MVTVRHILWGGNVTPLSSTIAMKLSSRRSIQPVRSRSSSPPARISVTKFFEQECLLLMFYKTGKVGGMSVSKLALPFDGAYALRCTCRRSQRRKSDVAEGMGCPLFQGGMRGAPALPLAVTSNAAYATS